MCTTLPQLSISVPALPEDSLLVRPGIQTPRNFVPKQVETLGSIFSYLTSGIQLKFSMMQSPRSFVPEASNTTPIFTYLANRIHTFGLNDRKKAVLDDICGYVQSVGKDGWADFEPLVTRLFAKHACSDIQALVVESKELIEEQFGTKNLVEDFVVELYKQDGQDKDARWFSIIVENMIGEKVRQAAEDYAPPIIRGGVKPKPWMQYLCSFFRSVRKHRHYTNIKNAAGSRLRLAKKIATFATELARKEHVKLGTKLFGHDEKIQFQEGLFGRETIYQEFEEGVIQFNKYIEQKNKKINKITQKIRVSCNMFTHSFLKDRLPCKN